MLYCHNQTTIHLVANPIFYETNKHIKVDCHFIRDHIRPRTITTTHLPTHQQQVDIITKLPETTIFHDLMAK